MLHKVDQLLDFWLKHSIQIIIIGFILFVLFCIYLILDLLRSQNQTSGESLQVHHQSGGVVLGTDQSSSGQPMIADTALLAKIAQSEMQIQKLQESLKSKDSEIETLKTQSSSESTGGAAASASGEDVAAYVKKISDLEARLLEYEILEDDIADLSLFKEENQKLKQEIEQLKANPSVSTASVETPKIVQQAEAISDKLEAAPMAPETVTAAPTEVANDAGPSISDQVNDLLNQALSEQIEEVSASGPDVHTPAEEAIVSAVPAEPQPSDDLMTEFSASAAETDGSQESDNGLDTEKMMNELASLDAVQGDGSSGLDGDSDIQKMADEADKLLGS